ncbi:hypothetical protein HBI56_039710 [Parastagonospora nodorum]|uniref:Uncharacterized protein n=1 Tax=Phaeosphaeria nodorum (strain SN15 / ATCC MYA-4574 / FGSC 10173) TaxID=321614 RepID=A0A7U2EWW5_PHANO|nr:hypothetical protein HBH56_067050 [Parastagonospora nodorum]QRC93393.1 hypothetical protein JI435_036270 [Parastagonospora nodorum SN15]KAH3932731.1 hypothetical protein HBH54_081030 [Parastagonospora nodorum]KAH4143741.1 hypothetical protein HBH45_036050 [Parastagonospora nodorum]KAH4165587.1 hypothetical protein HBH44_067280 [Parastagonospora nodorum]
MEEDIPSTSLADMTISETSTELPLFFTIPQELRDIVYHELWKLTPRTDLNVILGGRLQHITIQYGCYEASPSSKGQFSGLPQWLLSNNAFFDEGFCQLFQRAAWTAGDDWYPNGGCPKSNHRNTLAGIIAATNLIIRMDISASEYIWTSELDNIHKSKQKVNFFCNSRHYQDLTEDEMPDLKSLEIEMKCPNTTVLDRQGYALDLRCFKPSMYPLNLDRFRIKLILQDDFKTPPNARRFREVLRPTIELEMLRFGPVLVGKNYRLDIDEHLPAILLSTENNQTKQRGANDEIFIAWTMSRNQKTLADMHHFSTLANA